MEPPDHKMYREKSRMLMEYLRTFTSEIEQVSVDECYMDFTSIASRYHSPVDGALEIKDGIKNRFGFTVNIGISTNKLLAKMASDFESRTGYIRCSRRRSGRKCGRFPIGELYMAGRSSVETLKKAGDQYHRGSGSGGPESDYPSSEEPRKNAVGIRERDRNR